MRFDGFIGLSERRWWKVREKNGKAVVGILISYWSCLHREAFSFARRERYRREKYLSINLSPSSCSALWEKTTYLISEFGWRSEAWADEQTLLFLFWYRQSACTLSLPSLCVDCLFPYNWLVWGKCTQLWWKVLTSPNESIVPSHFPVHLYNKGTFWSPSALFLHLLFRWLEIWMKKHRLLINDNT